MKPEEYEDALRTWKVIQYASVAGTIIVFLTLVWLGVL